MRILLDDEIDLTPKGTIVVFQYEDSSRIYVARNNGKHWEYPEDVTRDMGNKSVRVSAIQVAAFVPERTDK